MERILGTSPYQSPTDMGVNMAGMAIVDDEACREAAKMEIVRRYFQAAVDERRTGLHHEYVEHLELLMNQVGVDTNFSPARSAALLKAEATGAPAGAMVLPMAAWSPAKHPDLLGAASSLLMERAQGRGGRRRGPVRHLRRGYRAHLRAEDVHAAREEPAPAFRRDAAGAFRVQRHRPDCQAAGGCSRSAARLRCVLQRDLEPHRRELYRTLGINICCGSKYEQRRYFHK